MDSKPYLDMGLIIECESKAGAKIHDVRIVISLYRNYFTLLRDSRDELKKPYFLRMFERAELELRKFLVDPLRWRYEKEA